ncbi:uncharacterized protein LOC109824044 isoform X2 [Asparagus officinalis]|uniref:uncharacterized protein LOC109824044 isoform X2 n=1 Tax=Asparagus officinalis TaxID=4686 RepID=UPI00098E8709|nr:uncharacterized protein LOC109824044 isoform X2 [Asparagus officinalis]
MSTAGATDEVPESPAKKPKLTSDQESTSEESTSDESEEDDDCFFGVDGRSDESEEDVDDYYGNGLHRMTDQERAIYKEAIRLSDGFDVPRLPKVFSFSLIRPAGRRWPAEDIREHADFAIKEQNEKRKTEEVIKCNLQVACPVNYYITLQAEDVITGYVDEYEALVMARCGKQKDELHIFRKKNKPAIINPPASTEHGPSDSDCAVEDPGKSCETCSWDRGETKRRRL